MKKDPSGQPGPFSMGRQSTGICPNLKTFVLSLLSPPLALFLFYLFILPRPANRVLISVCGPHLTSFLSYLLLVSSFCFHCFHLLKVHYDMIWLFGRCWTVQGRLIHIVCVGCVCVHWGFSMGQTLELTGLEGGRREGMVLHRLWRGCQESKHVRQTAARPFSNWKPYWTSAWGLGQASHCSIYWGVVCSDLNFGNLEL